MFKQVVKVPEVTELCNISSRIIIIVHPLIGDEGNPVCFRELLMYIGGAVRGVSKKRKMNTGIVKRPVVDGRCRYYNADIYK